MIVPLIITGHTSHEDKETIVDSRGMSIDVIKNIETIKDNNKELSFYTIYSVDETIQSDKYLKVFDKVLYSKNVINKFVGEKIKVEIALNYINDNIDFNCFVKTCSRHTLKNIVEYIEKIPEYDYIGSNWQTKDQYNTAMFIGSKELINAWIDCEPRMNVALEYKSGDWPRLYRVRLLENLFYESCTRNKIKGLILNNWPK